MEEQRARFQSLIEHDIQGTDDLTWTKGTHTFEFGVDIRATPFYVSRNSKQGQTLTSPEAVLDQGNFLIYPFCNTPPTCGAGVVTNCLNAAIYRPGIGFTRLAWA